MTERERNFLLDFGHELVLIAKHAQTVSESKDPFQLGLVTGIYEALSLYKEQAIAFGLTEADIGLENVVLEDLLK